MCELQRRLIKVGIASSNPNRKCEISVFNDKYKNIYEQQRGLVIVYNLYKTEVI